MGSKILVGSFYGFKIKVAYMVVFGHEMEVSFFREGAGGG